MSERLSSFMYGVYAWMTCALVLTACTAYYIALVPQVFAIIYGNGFTLFGLFLVQIGLIVGLSRFLHRMTLITALLMFLCYATLVGATLSIVFHVYTTASIFSAFLTTAGMFGGMSIYGYMTRSDLTAMGNIAIMMLWGLILGVVVNMFLRSPGIDFVLSGAGVIIFTLLTAYDTQKIKQLGQQMLTDQEMMEKVMILGALTLYLDFINLFLYLLRFMGRRRN
ncbi:MAG TPA: Bax inhibitor-1/YccA family protein [Candidatus Dependentiae bacterium]|nr:Bax inhibitor-1/YccA family protein [Candidatus Dependentiae bacterium]